MTTVEEFAPAKVNLALHITGQRDDGYHLLDSLIVFPNIGDRLTATSAESLSLTVDGPMSVGVPTGPDNLMMQAAAWLDGSRGAAVSLTKHLPHPAGIGGGSSDAAGTLRMLSRLWGVSLPEAAETLGLGADLPVCIVPKPQRVRGIGEVLSLEPTLPPFWLVLVNPGLACPTPAVFARLHQKANAPLDDILGFDGFGDFRTWLMAQRNDLEAPAIAEVPVITDVLEALSVDAALARMSGSGATCFGLYETEQQAQRCVDRLRCSGWWVRAASCA